MVVFSSYFVFLVFLKELLASRSKFQLTPIHVSLEKDELRGDGEVWIEVREEKLMNRQSRFWDISLNSEAVSVVCRTN